MRKNGTLTYLLGDHLGSTSLTTDSSGNLVSELRYKPWGETRYSSGTTATSYRYTGQREEAGFGLYFYNARWMDPVLGRFVQADTIVPGGVQGLDRYAYVNNSPMNYVDPSGHTPVCGFSYSDPECEKTSKKQIIDPPDEKTAGEVLYNLAGGDEMLYEIWLKLYLTQAGYDLAVYIYEHDVQMMFGGEEGSYTKCASYGCTIYLSKKYMPSAMDPAAPIDINRAAAELGHEAFHASVWRRAPDGGWWENLLRELGLADSEVSNSQWEEAMASFVGSEIYFEFTGIPDVIFESLYVTDPDVLRAWTRQYNYPYRGYPLYPRNP
ncbi:MAG: RHS repeat-associated core domain-containing protein [Chloroflexota bacterium]